jgi:pilus assembly protein CpaF
MSVASQTQEPFPARRLAQLRAWLLERVSVALSSNGHEPSREQARRLLESAYAHAKVQLPHAQRETLFNQVLDDLLGLGPLQDLLDDPSISEIMVNGKDRVYVEKAGKLVPTDLSFPDEAAVQRIIERIISPLGRRIDADNPTVDARLPDGSRVNAVIPPVAIDGPGITIRKFSRDRLGMKDLVRLGSISEGLATFAQACVVARLNILISGGTGSGKTTLLNILSEFIPEGERIITIEDAAELQLHQDHVFRLEAKPANLDGKGQVTIRHLVHNALRMRPDRIVVGEVRGGEALDMLQAMNTGHEGSLTTVHANSPRDALRRLETLALLSGVELPLRVVREQIASAVDLVIQQARLRDGSRRVVSVAEVVGMEGEVVVMSEIFKFKEEGISSEGQVLGDLAPTGIRPMFSPKLQSAGFKLSPEVFGADLHTADTVAKSRH